MSSDIKEKVHEWCTQAVMWLVASVLLIVVAWIGYAWIRAWRPYWAGIFIFGGAHVAGYLVTHFRRAGTALSFKQRIIHARDPLIACAIFAVFVWRLHELIVDYRPHWGTVATFCIGFCTGVAVALHSKWEKGWRMNPRLKQLLLPIASGLSYVGCFMAYVFGYVMIGAFLYDLYEVFAPYWKIIAWFIGCLAFLVIVGWLDNRKDRICAAKLTNSEVSTQSRLALTDQRSAAGESRSAWDDEQRP